MRAAAGRTHRTPFGFARPTRRSSPCNLTATSRPARTARGREAQSVWTGTRVLPARCRTAGSWSSSMRGAATAARRVTPTEYDAWYDNDRGRWIGEVEQRLLVELLSSRAGERVLDAGCGSGWFTRRIAAMDGGRDAYLGAHWHTQAEIVAALADLPVASLRFRTAVLLPGGMPLARLAPWLGRCAPFGSFLVVAGDKACGAARSPRSHDRAGEFPGESPPPFGSTTRTFSPVPRFASDSSTRPPMRSATARTIDSPSPEPTCPVPGTR